jgi:hypothetical protein
MSALSFCSYVSGVGRQCWGPLAPCSRVAAAWCRTRLVLSCSAPLLFFPVPVSALEPRPCSRTGPPLPSRFLLDAVARTPPRRANPIPSFPFFPHSNSRWESAMADALPTSCPTGDPLHAASVFSALRHHLRPPGYKCSCACLSSIPPSDPK